MTARFISEHFIPVGLHVRREPEEFQRVGEKLNVAGAATAVVVDPSGSEILRIEGFHAPEDYRHLLEHALSHHGHG